MKLTTLRYPGERSSLAVLLAVLAAMGLGLLAATGASFFLVLAVVTLVLWAGRLIQRVNLLGGAVRVSGLQFPDIDSIVEEACRRLEIDTPPECYVRFSPVPNAYTFGFSRRIFVLHSYLVEHFTPQELAFIIGHELGHSKLGHTRMTVLLGPQLVRQGPCLGSRSGSGRRLGRRDHRSAAAGGARYLRGVVQDGYPRMLRSG